MGVLSMQEKNLTIREASKVSRMSQAWWRKKILDREIRFLRIGSRIFIPEATIKEMFANAVVEPTKDWVMKTPVKRLLSAKETAEYLGIAVRTLYNQTSRNAKVKFPVKPKKIGKWLKFDIQELDAYIDNL